MKRYLQVDNDALIEAAYVAKLDDDGTDTTITVNWDSAANGVDTFTVSGVAGVAYLTRLAEAINFSKQVVIKASDV